MVRKNSLPRQMKAMTISQPGGPESLVLATVGVPQPTEDELLVQVAAAGLNRMDILQRKGLYPPPPGASPYPGVEIAGTVVAKGSHVKAYHVGDLVCALVSGGGYAEYCAVPAIQALPLPTGISLREAAALPEAIFALWGMLYDEETLRPGESLLVHGGASGIGTTAIQLCTAKNNKVYVTAGTAEKCQACIQLGAVAAVNYQEEDFVAAILRATEGKGVAVVLDAVGGDYIARDLEVLAEGGRLVSIGFIKGARLTLNALPLLTKRLSWKGYSLRPRPAQEKGAIARQVHKQVWPLIESGAFKPIVDSVFPLDQAPQAHARMESGEHIGKILLVMEKE